ncbi:MAG: helix-turn-helix domain-containing protein [Sedimentisphaerales bacterium]
MNTNVRNEPQTPCLAMRAKEAAKAIGISERTLWQWTEDGYVPHIRRGKVVLYPVDALRDWLRGQAREGTKPDRESEDIPGFCA